MAWMADAVAKMVAKRVTEVVRCCFCGFGIAWRISTSLATNT